MAISVFVGSMAGIFWVGNQGLPTALSHRLGGGNTPVTSTHPAVPFYTSIGISSLPSPHSVEDEIPVSQTFTIELAVVDSMEKADAMLDDLLARGISAFYTPVHSEGRSYFRVRKGFFGNETAAKAAAAKLASHRIQGQVIRLR
jgi:cell division septation protein DedD